MKNKILASLLLAALVLAVSSCATQKYGCPGNPQSSYKFKG